MFTTCIEYTILSYHGKNQSLALAAVQFTKYSSPLHNVRIAQENCPIYTQSLLRFFRITIRLRLHPVGYTVYEWNGKMLTVYVAHTTVPSEHRKVRIWWQATVLQVIFHCEQVTRNNVHYIYSPHNGTFVSHSDQSLVSAPLNFTEYQKNFLVRNS